MFMLQAPRIRESEMASGAGGKQPFGAALAMVADNIEHVITYRSATSRP